MKKKLYILVITALSCLTAGLVSCDDYFDLRPQSEITLEDFWENEADVASAVGACYRGMNQEGFLKRMIVWGEVRSDNVVGGGNINNPNDGDAQALSRILNLSLTADNSYTYWGEVYSVINNCNNVIRFAPEVKKKDPNFSEIQFNTYMAEAVGIRALCYFTLLRTFRDIPLITEPTIDDSKPFEIEQARPDSVINFLIRDLKNVENKAMKTFKNNRVYDKGRITQKAIWALLADIYLWNNEYNNCIAYCDKILNDPEYRIDLELQSSATYNLNVFVTGNSKESIFELQFDPLNVRNNTIYKFYSYYDAPFGGTVFLLASYNFDKKKSTFFTSSDLRGKDAVFLESAYNGSYPIMKYTYYRQGVAYSQLEKDYTSTRRINDGSPNWIFYRLPDIYLMKAEALVEKNNLEEAYSMVRLSYNRANPENELPEIATHSQEALRNLVFDERQREFLFEGKRYFDLLRRIKRENSPTFVVQNFLIRKYVHLDMATVRTKLSDMDALFMPINKTELKLNTKLVQNPFYVESQDIIKN